MSQLTIRDRPRVGAAEPTDAVQARGVVGPERALDDLLARIERRNLSPMELRVLLWLAEREATPVELREALRGPTGAISHATRCLDMRGLIRRRFERGPRSRFVLSITTAGLLALQPLVQRVADTGPAGRDELWQSVLDRRFARS
jgi:DNA-binding MarR family transcriptional regulator